MILEDEAIDVRDLEQILGITITNPFFRVKINNSFHAKLVIKIRDFYAKYRRFLKRIWKEDYSTALLYNSQHVPFWKEDKDNSANKQFDVIDEKKLIDPFFNLEYVQFSEFIPKESLYELRKQIQKFKSKYVHPNDFNFYDQERDYEYYAEVNRYDFQTPIAGFMINPSSDLGNFFSKCEINMESASLSFVLISFKMSLNEEWKKKINDICVKRIYNYPRYFYLDKVKLRDARSIEKGAIAGGRCKEILFQCIIEEIKYRTVKILRDNFNLITNDLKASCDSFLYFETNINGNGDRDFWQSMCIYPFHCYFSDQYDACITFIGNNIICINRFNKKYNYYGGLFQSTVGEDYNHLIAYSNIRSVCNEQITDLNKMIHLCKDKKVEIWMALRNKSLKNSHYILRFLREYQMKTDFQWTFRNHDNKWVFSDKYVEHINQELNNTFEDITSTIERIDVRAEEENNKASYDMQHHTFITNFLSAFFAFIAIIISIILNDDSKKRTFAIIETNTFIKYILIGMIGYIVIWIIVKIVKTLIIQIDKKRIIN